MTEPSLPRDLAERLERERAFHDELAHELGDPREIESVHVGPLEQAMLDLAAPGRGQHVLDLGCGVGDLTLELLDRGAEVTAIDVSPGMVELARRRQQHAHPEAGTTFVAAPVEASGLPAARFDLVVGRFILHHLDLAFAAAELGRIMKPGARAIFAENSGRNQLLMLARRRVAGRFGVPRYGTEDEHPLSKEDVAALGTAFTVRLHYPVFEFWRIFDRQVLRFRSPRLSKICAALDHLCQRSALLRHYSYRVVVELRSR